MMALQKVDEDDQTPTTKLTSTEQSPMVTPEKRGMTRVRSGSNLAAIVVDQK